jgi:hypothetical protein
MDLHNRQSSHVLASPIPQSLQLLASCMLLLSKGYHDYKWGLVDGLKGCVLNPSNYRRQNQPRDCGHAASSSDRNPDQAEVQSVPVTSESNPKPHHVCKCPRRLPIHCHTKTHPPHSNNNVPLCPVQSNRQALNQQY